MQTEPKTRSTRQQQAVLDALDESTGFRTAQQLYVDLRQAGEKVGLATVYRSLQRLADSGDVDVIISSDGGASYRRCSTGHHHHLVCRSCGRTVEVKGPTVERWANRVSAEHDFHEVSHDVELFGLCPDCFAKR